MPRRNLDVSSLHGYKEGVLPKIFLRRFPRGALCLGCDRAGCANTRPARFRFADIMPTPRIRSKRKFPIMEPILLFEFFVSKSRITCRLVPLQSCGSPDEKSWKSSRASTLRPRSRWVLLALVEREVWQGPQDIKNLYRSVDFLSGNRVVFNIGGNNFRLVVVVRYTASVILIDRIGTHSEYSKWKLE